MDGKTIDEMSIEELRGMLKEYKEILPCRPGDIVYRISQSRRKIIPMKIHSIRLNEGRIKITCIDPDDRIWRYRREELNEYVFLGIEIAERRFKENG